LIIQILNIALPDVFSKYREKYNFSQDEYFKGLLGLELRLTSSELSSEVIKSFNQIKTIYKFKNNVSNSLDLIILGTLQMFKNISDNIIFPLDDILSQTMKKIIFNYEDYDNKKYVIGGKEFIFNRSYVMGILNVTPDSFSDGGEHYDKDDAIKYGLYLLDEGADIVDIGGESTRPGANLVSESEEINRILPVIQGILSVYKDAIISVDTTKPAVAELSLKAGASIINDVSGLQFNPDLLEIVKKYNASFVIMHMKGDPRTMQRNPEYRNLIQEIYDFLYTQSQKAELAGVYNLFIDPGIGFGKTVDHNFEILKRLGDFKSLGYPIIIGNSRKSFLGNSLNIANPNERDLASAVVNAASICNGAKVIRTHNIQYGVQTAKLINNIS
jgi:dihydropteroate synthase